MARRRKLLGEVSLLGLNEFGQNPGLRNEYGLLIGGGVSALTSIVVGRTTKADKRALYGMLAGVGASGAMWAMKSTRHAALWSLAGTLLGSGLAWLEQTMSGGKVAGLGIPSLNFLNGGGLGVPSLNWLNGLESTMISPVPQSHGTIPGVAGPSFAGSRLGGEDPISLLGEPTAQSEKIMLLGGPAVHGLSASYGATLLGGGRS